MWLGHIVFGSQVFFFKLKLGQDFIKEYIQSDVSIVSPVEYWPKVTKKAFNSFIIFIFY